MENENKTKKTEQRVVLNLSMDQAKELKQLLLGASDCARMQEDNTTLSIADRIYERLHKTITKHETSKTCKNCGGPSTGEYCTYNCAGTDEKNNGVTQ
jgi:hypothetical protein